MTSPLDSVPGEIFSLIFQEAGTLPYDRMAGSPFQVKRYADIATLLSISEVCQRWREISLGDGRLWASAISLDDDNPAWVEELTRRAKDAPLTIHSRKSDYDSQVFETQNWKCAFACVNNWGILSFHAVALHPQNTGPLMDALVRPADNLKVFRIFNLNQLPHGDIDDDDFNNNVLVLPDNLFAGHAPRLRVFDIHGAYLRPSFDFSVWEKLTELNIEQTFGGLQGNKISSRKWLEILREVKGLSTLALVWNLPYGYVLPAELERDRSFETIADVHLDHLCKLYLTAISERHIMFDIFSKLVIPDTCLTLILVDHSDLREVGFDGLSTGLDHRVKRWRATNTPFHFRLLQDKISWHFGFRIDHELNGLTDRSDVKFRFCYYQCYPEPLGEDGNPVQSPDKAGSPYYRMLEVMKKATQTSTLTSFTPTPFV